MCSDVGRGGALISGDWAVPGLLGDSCGSVMGIEETLTTGGSVGNHDGEVVRRGVGRRAAVDVTVVEAVVAVA